MHRAKVCSFLLFFIFISNVADISVHTLAVLASLTFCTNLLKHDWILNLAYFIQQKLSEGEREIDVPYVEHTDIVSMEKESDEERSLLTPPLPAIDSNDNHSPTTSADDPDEDENEADINHLTDSKQNVPNKNKIYDDNMAMESERFEVPSPPAASDIIRNTRRLRQRIRNGQVKTDEFPGLDPPPIDIGAEDATPEPSHFYLPLPREPNNNHQNQESFNAHLPEANDAFETSDSSIKSSYYRPNAHQSESSEWLDGGRHRNRYRQNYHNGNGNDASEEEQGVSLFLPYIPPIIPRPTVSPIHPHFNQDHPQFNQDHPHFNQDHPALFHPANYPPISNHIQNHIQSINEPNDFEWPGPIANVPHQQHQQHQEYQQNHHQHHQQQPEPPFSPVPQFPPGQPFKVFSFIDIFKLAAQQMQPNNNFVRNR